MKEKVFDMIKIPKKLVSFLRGHAAHWLAIPLLYLIFRGEENPKGWNTEFVQWEPFFSIGYIFLLWEGNYFICTYWSRRFPGFETTVRRLIRQVLTCTVYILLLNLLTTRLFVFLNVVEAFDFSNFRNNFLMGLVLSYLIIAIYEGIDFYKGWKTHLIKAEILAREKSEIQLALVDAQLSALRDQLNPHFLFNSLNTLSSLIDLKNNKAITYLEQLADVYRYLLENREKHLVPLDEELAFAEAYISLNKTRFRNDLTYKVASDQPSGSLLIPPYALQLTLENAIKHNAIGPDMPLEITVSAEQDYLVITNNRRPRPVLATSTGVGLENLRHRSLLATGKPVEVIKNNELFTVKVPLVHQQNLPLEIPGNNTVTISENAYRNY